MWWIEPFEINACVFSHVFNQYAYGAIVLLTPPKEDPHGKHSDLPMADDLLVFGSRNRTQLSIRANS
jgi:hypothetical protein